MRKMEKTAIGTRAMNEEKADACPFWFIWRALQYEIVVQCAKRKTIFHPFGTGTLISICSLKFRFHFRLKCFDVVFRRTSQFNELPIRSNE